MAQQCVRVLVVLTHVYLAQVFATAHSSKKPPMGWISWNKFGCQRDCAGAPETCIGERLVKRTGDAMISLGLRDLGYRYVILDDCWANPYRDPMSLKYSVSSAQFPQGVLPVSRYLRDRNMSLGLLFMEACDGRNTMEVDAKTAMKFELDYLKMYGCSTEKFGVLESTLANSGRKMITACSGYNIINMFVSAPQKVDWSSIIRHCSAWRVMPISGVNWNEMLQVLTLWRRSYEVFTSLSGRSHYGDLGTLGIGYAQLSMEEQRSQMAMWCLLASPLIVSADFNTLDKGSLELLKNRRLIDINQDSKCRAPRFLKTEGGVQYWMRVLGGKGNTWAIAFLNENSARVKISIRLMDMCIRSVSGKKFNYSLTDVFSGNKLGTFELWQPIPLELNAHDTQMFLAEFVDPRKSVETKQ